MEKILQNKNNVCNTAEKCCKILCGSTVLFKKKFFFNIPPKSGLWVLFMHTLVAKNHSSPNLLMVPYWGFFKKGVFLNRTVLGNVLLFT